MISNAALEALTNSMMSLDTKRASARVAIYGENGTGKSVTAAAILDRVTPSNLGILHIDTGEGFTSIRNHRDDLVPGIARWKSIPYESYEQVQAIIDAIENKQGIFGFIGGVQFDEMSTMAKADLDFLHGARTGGAEGASLVPEWPDYNALLTRWRRIMLAVTRIPDLHITITAHEKARKAKVGRDMVTTGYGPDFPVETAKAVKENVHVVARMRNTEGPRDPQNLLGAPVIERLGQVIPANKYEAKTRIPTALSEIYAEDMPEWVASWLETGARPTPEPDMVPAEEIRPAIESVEPELQADYAEGLGEFEAVAPDADDDFAAIATL